MDETMRSTAHVAAVAPARSIRWSSVALWLFVFSLLALLGWGLINSNATRPEAGQKAPDFEMAFFNGYEWETRPSASLAEFKGNVVVLNFWASWCVECKVEAKLLEDTWRKYRDQGVVFLGITYADVEPNALQYLVDYDITYPNAPDLGTAISDEYEITGVPETFFIDKSGVISYVHLGPASETLLNGQLEGLLAQSGS
jgi:cytochrome c biogenesis protein CcmG/thiol:disulfide interchange protein DsbE